jgi:hypothetical protein
MRIQWELVMQKVNSLIGILAPYGSLDNVRIITKVGIDKTGPSKDSISSSLEVKVSDKATSEAK